MTKIANILKLAELFGTDKVQFFLKSFPKNEEKFDEQEFQNFVIRVDQIRSASLNKNVRIVTGPNENVLR